MWHQKARPEGIKMPEGMSGERHNDNNRKSRINQQMDRECMVQTDGSRPLSAADLKVRQAF